MMIQLKALRTKVVLFGGSTMIRNHAAELILDTDSRMVLVKHRQTKAVYFVPCEGFENAEPVEEPEGVFSDTPPPINPALAVKLKEIADKAEANGKPSIAAVVVTLDKQYAPPLTPTDEVRMVKINGQVVERKGEPKADEIIAQEIALVERLERLSTLSDEDLTNQQKADVEEYLLDKATRPAPKIKKPATIGEMLATASVSDT